MCRIGCLIRLGIEEDWSECARVSVTELYFHLWMLYLYVQFSTCISTDWTHFSDYCCRVVLKLHFSLRFFLYLELLVCYSCSLPLFKIVVPLCHTFIHEKYNYFRAFFQFHAAHFAFAFNVRYVEPRGVSVRPSETERKCLSFLIDQHIWCCALVTPWQCWFRLFFSVTFCYVDVVFVVFHLCSEEVSFLFLFPRFFFGNGMSSRASSPSWFH